MSIFKTLGQKIKRVVSIKNVLNAATGNFTAIASDAKRVLTTQAPIKKGSVNTPIEKTFVSYDTPSFVNDILTVKGKDFNQRLIKTVSSSNLVQDNIGQTNGFFAQIWANATWIKYKTWFIAGFVLIGALIGWKLYSKKGNSRGRVRR